MSIICNSFICFLLFFTSSVTSSTTDDEDALLKIKKQLGDPEILRSWVKGFNFCNFSIQLPSGEDDDNIYILCTDTGRVSSFVIQYLDTEITAPFPDAVCDLTELEELIITMVPGLYGSVPSCVTDLWKLRSFVITYTSVSGPVPGFYIHTKINAIDLEHNHLSGTIPTSLSSLPNLQQLDLSYNNLTGTMPRGLRSRSLDLSFNNLTGKIPKCYQWMDFLDFNVYSNHLTGDASFLFGKQKSAETINLGYNNFEFDLSDVEFSDKLTWLDLSHNRIYGNVSDSIARILYGEPERYMYLDLSNNELCGELPQPPDSNRRWRYGFDVFANNLCLCGYPLPPCSGSGSGWPPLSSWSPAPSPVSEPPF